ncbi:unnamed protein product [Arctia plantaginis]|uniref:Uncharacterized protein n=1 Tax=Arctia plantaginis TaxID=874455 RepID=A0A8S0Z2S1_ARCPL|nr:unnamed protein product [Arctia plantaginis]
MSPFKRSALSAKLKTDSALSVHRSLADTVMEDNDVEPTHLPTLGTLRQIKYQTKKASFYDPNPTISLWLMAQTPPYNDLIRHISLHPYFVIYYWLSAQELYYKKYIAKHRVIMSLDATGSILKEYTHRNMKITKHIFLYVCVVQTFDGKSSLPTLQMISESQTMDTIAKWLKNWSEKNTPPNELVCDDSSALIGAAVKAFTKHTTTKEYLDESFQLLNLPNCKFPQCYIRLNTNHFSKILNNLGCFKNIDPRVKFFYVSLKNIKQCQDYEVIKQTVKDMVTLCLSKYIGSVHGNVLRSDEARMRLKNLSVFKKKDSIEKINININNDSSDYKRTSVFQNINTDLENEHPEIHINKGDIRVKWLLDHIITENLINELEEENLENIENLYYMPSLVDNLLRYISQVPLWSNCMMNIYDSQIDAPTSSNVENYFKSIKRFLLNLTTKSHRLRIDDFILVIIVFCLAKLNLQ